MVPNEIVKVEAKSLMKLHGHSDRLPASLLLIYPPRLLPVVLPHFRHANNDFLRSNPITGRIFAIITLSLQGRGQSGDQWNLIQRSKDSLLRHQTTAI